SDIQTLETSCTTRVGDGASQGLQPFRSACAEHHGMACLGQYFGRGLADAAAGTGDQNNLLSLSLHHVSPWFRMKFHCFDAMEKRRKRADTILCHACLILFTAPISYDLNTRPGYDDRFF